MSEEDISLFDLLNLSIGTPNLGAVNFSALQVLLHALLKQLDIRQMKTRWNEGDSGGGIQAILALTQLDFQTEKERLAKISAEDGDCQPETEPQERIESAPSPTPSGPSEEDHKSLQSRVQTCEEGVFEAMKLIKELQDQKEEMKELLSQQTAAAQTEAVSSVEKCCHRVDELQDTVRALTDQLQKFPEPEELSQCVTWDVMQSALLSERETIQKELVNTITAGNLSPRPADPPAPPAPADTAVPPPQEPTVPPPTPQEPTVPPPTTTAPEAPSVPSEPPPPPQPEPPKAVRAAAGMALARKSSGSERYPETVEALKNVGKLKEKFGKLEARLAALEERKVDKAQLTQLKELVTNKGSTNLMDQLNQQKTLIDHLMGDREKLTSLEEMVMNFTNQESEPSSQAAAGTMDADSKVAHELRQQMSYVRKSVQKLEEDVKQLKSKMTVTEERARDRHLQDQLDELRGRLEDMMLSLTSQLSPEEEEEEEEEEEGQTRDRAALTNHTVTTGRKLSRLFQHYEQLQETVNTLLQQTAGSAGPKDSENSELVSNVQKAIQQLQAECERLHETARRLHEDNQQKQTHIEELYKTTEELAERKADKNMLEEETQKADKLALDSKVSRLQFDSVTEQLNALFHELLNKVTGHEHNWGIVMDRLNTEMDCKLNRIELESVKKQLEDRWKTIHQKLQAQGAPEHEDAAGLRKQLVDRFHCLSCDRPVVKYSPLQFATKVPPSPGFPAHKSVRPFTVYALEQFRQHYRSLKPGTNRYNFEVANSNRRREQLQKSHDVMCRKLESAQKKLKTGDRAASVDPTRGDQAQKKQGAQHSERISELTEYGQLTVSRSCGGSHTVTSTGHRRGPLQHAKQHNPIHNPTEVEANILSEEVDIVGLDGHIYKGRLNTPDIRSRETKLPTIPTRDGFSRPKDRSKSSVSHRPTATPEVQLPPHPHSAKSGQVSRSASSSSVRDWPVSTLGSSAAAESNTEQQADETQSDH